MWASSLLSHPLGYLCSAHGTSTDHSHCLPASRCQFYSSLWIFSWSHPFGFSGYTRVSVITFFLILHWDLPLPPPPLLGRAYDLHHSGSHRSETLSAHLVTTGNAWEKKTFQQGTRTRTCRRAHGKLEGEPDFESDARHHSHGNKLCFISFNPSSTAFTCFLLYLQVTAVIVLWH